MLPLSQFHSEAVGLPLSAWVSVAGLVCEPERGPSQGCNARAAWAGMVSAQLSGHTSGSSFAEMGDYRYLNSLYLLLSPLQSSKFCRQETLSPADPTAC